MALDKKENALVKAMRDFRKGLLPKKQSPKKVEEQIKAFEDYCTEIEEGKVRYLSNKYFEDVIVGNFERIAHYAEHEPDTKTKFKRHNIEDDLTSLIDSATMFEEYANMFFRIESTSSAKPGLVKGHISKLCVEYKKFMAEHARVKKVIKSQKKLSSTEETLNLIVEQIYRVNEAKVKVDTIYNQFKTRLKPVYESTQTSVNSFFERHILSTDEQAKIDAAKNSLKDNKSR